MADTLLRAAPGRQIRDPETGEVLEGSFKRPLTGYYLRALRDGDLYKVESKPAAKERDK